ncbi:hypothetical protein BC567DRAFT_213011 [Phyllosticta citribraziliensis]
MLLPFPAGRASPFTRLHGALSLIVPPVGSSPVPLRPGACIARFLAGVRSAARKSSFVAVALVLGTTRRKPFWRPRSIGNQSPFEQSVFDTFVDALVAIVESHSSILGPYQRLYRLLPPVFLSNISPFVLGPSLCRLPSLAVATIIVQRFRLAWALAVAIPWSLLPIFDIFYPPSLCQFHLRPPRRVLRPWSNPSPRWSSAGLRVLCPWSGPRYLTPPFAPLPSSSFLRLLLLARRSSTVVNSESSLKVLLGYTSFQSEFVMRAVSSGADNRLQLGVSAASAGTPRTCLHVFSVPPSVPRGHDERLLLLNASTSMPLDIPPISYTQAAQGIFDSTPRPSSPPLASPISPFVSFAVRATRRFHADTLALNARPTSPSPSPTIASRRIYLTHDGRPQKLSLVTPVSGRPGRIKSFLSINQPPLVFL